MERHSFHIVLGETVPFRKIPTPGKQVKLRYFSQCVLRCIDVEMMLYVYGETVITLGLVNPLMSEQFFRKKLFSKKHPL